MSNEYDYSVSSQTRTAEIDAGLRAHMLKVYNYMAAGVGLTGLVAYFTAQSPALLSFLFQPGVSLIVMLSPLAFVLVLSFGINKLSAGAMQAVFWAFAACFGLSLSSIFIVYEMGSIARIFFITMIMFSALSAYGYTTKKDLSAMGTFMFMGLIGLIIASVINIFLQSSAIEFGISVIGVLVFAGLTAWDNQKIKQNYFAIAGNGELMAKASIMGALALYLDFINMFLFLLRLFGGGRD